VPVGPQVPRVVQALAGAMLGEQLVALRCSPGFPLCSLHQLVKAKLGVVLGIVVGRVEFIPEGEQSAAHLLQGVEDGPHLVRPSGQAVNGQDRDAVNPP
jgi:hypothetical protein